MTTEIDVIISELEAQKERLERNLSHIRQQPMERGLSLEEKAVIKTLHAEGVSYNSIALKLNRSPHTIKAFLTQPEVKGEVMEIKAELSEMYETLSRRMLDSITNEDIARVNAYQRVIAAAAATDKMRLLKNQSTANISIAHRFMQLQDEVEQT